MDIPWGERRRPDYLDTNTRSKGLQNCMNVSLDKLVIRTHLLQHAQPIVSLYAEVVVVFAVVPDAQTYGRRIQTAQLRQMIMRQGELLWR